MIEAMKAEFDAFDRVHRQLTPRQHQVFNLICEGLNSTEIAERLGITVNTAIEHSRTIGRRLGYPIAEARRRAWRQRELRALIAVRIAADCAAMRAHRADDCGALARLVLAALACATDAGK